MVLRQFRIKSKKIESELNSSEIRKSYEDEKEKISNLLSVQLQADISFLKDGTIQFTTEKTLQEVREFVNSNNLQVMANTNYSVQTDDNGTNIAEKIDEL